MVGEKFSTWLPVQKAFLVALLLLYCLFVNYGSPISRLTHIREARVEIDAAREAFYTKELVSRDSHADRDLRSALYRRFKLCTTEPDEALVIMSLSRMDPGRLDFNPRLFQYGGVFIYGAGVLFKCASAVGIITTAGIDHYMDNPGDLFRIYVVGRYWVLLLFLLSAIVVTRTFRDSRHRYLYALFYLSLPLCYMLARVMKPHLMSLLFVWLSYSAMMRHLDEGRSRSLYHSAVWLGLAAGSVLTNGFFGAYLCVLLARARAPHRARVLLVYAAIALAVFTVTNPYVLANPDMVRGGIQNLRSFWTFNWDTAAVAGFAARAVLSSWSIGFLLVFGYTLVAAIGKRRRGLLELCFFLAGLGWLFALTFTKGDRTVLRLLPCLVVLFMILAQKAKVPGAVLAAAVLLNLPYLGILGYNYYLETTGESNRMMAARWIDETVPPVATIHVTEARGAPFAYPPFNFEVKSITQETGARYYIAQGNEIKFDGPPASLPYEPIRLYRKRALGMGEWAVFGHLNPQVIIYRRSE